VLRELLDRTLVSEYRREHSPALLASLAIDGFEWGDGRLVAAMPVPVPLAGEMTRLEATLQARGFAVAGQHYRQAVDNFTDGNYEAGNGQLRSSLESLVPALGVHRGAQQNVGVDAAIQYLHRNGDLDDEERNWFRSLWSGIQDNGPHAGLTDEAEARFRLHTVTAGAIYLLAKVP
jgi:hypothetical protein